MKKNIGRTAVFAAAVLFAVGASGLLSACGKGEHVHDYRWVTTTEPTCTQTGVRTGTCQNSGCSEEERVVEAEIPALGHLWGSWKMTEPYATCTQPGGRVRTCTREGCGEQETGEIPALGHDWDAGVPVAGNEATCTQAGKMIYHCLECSETETRDVPALGHTWRLLERTKDPTCTEPGSESHVCTVCGEQDDSAVVPPLGHIWETTKVTPATCTEPGVRTRTCTRAGCHETATVEIEPLGHNWEGFYTVDTPATFEGAGERSYHCARCGERDETRIEVIPKLDENTPIEYEFHLLRNNGAAVTDPSVVIRIYDENDVEVARSRPSTLKNGVFKVSLLPREYSVKIDATSLPAGYSAEEEYRVNFSDPVCRLRLTASPIKDTPAASVKYTVGSVMYDFTYQTLNGETITLSELLKKYQLVVLNFFYVGCTWCRTEFPGLIKAYEAFKDDVCVIAIDPDPYGGDSESAIRTYANEFGMTFYVVRDTALRLHTRFGVTAYPQTAFIDREGVVAEFHTEAIGTSEESSEKLFSAIFARYTADAGEESTAPSETALPARRKED